MGNSVILKRGITQKYIILRIAEQNALNNSIHVYLHCIYSQTIPGTVDQK